MRNTQKTSIFIVGASRSGTTVLAESLGRHPNIHSCRELHYYNLLHPKLLKQGFGGEPNTIELLKKIELENAILHVKNNFDDVCEELGFKENQDIVSKKCLYKFFDFLRLNNNASVVVEQTPMNLFYTKEIEKEFPSSIFITMTRDIRAILASQKNRWKVGANGSEFIPEIDLKRVKYSGHPIIQLILFRKIAKNIKLMSQKSNNIMLSYEGLILEPSKSIKSICTAIGIEYDAAMLSVSDKGSSHVKEVSSNGFDSSRLLSWKNSLTSTETWLCQNFYPEFLYGDTISCKPKLTELLQLLVSFPYYLIRSVSLSINSYGNFFDALVLRFLK